MKELDAVKSLLDTFDQWLAAALEISAKDIRRELQENKIKNKISYECVEVLDEDSSGAIAHSGGREYTVVVLLVPSGTSEERIALIARLYWAIRQQDSYRLTNHDRCRELMERVKLSYGPAAAIAIPLTIDEKKTEGKIVTNPLVISMHEKTANDNNNR